MGDKPINAWAEMTRPDTADLEREARFGRRYARLERWAMQRDSAELAEHYAMALMLALEFRRLLKEQSKSLDSAQFWAMNYKNGVEEMALKLRKQLLERRRIAAKTNAPKQAAKACAFELWNERRAGKHPKLRTVEQFATEVMRRWPVLTSSKVICGWSAQWTREAQAGTAPVR